MGTQITAVVLLFQMLKSPREKKLADLINQKGGAEAVLKDDKLLAEIASSDEARDFSSASASSGGKNKDDEALKRLRKDLATDVDATLQKIENILIGDSMLRKSS